MPWATVLVIACSTSSAPAREVQPEPPSDAAAPWVGCYSCGTKVTAAYFASVGDSATISVDDNALSIVVSGNALTGNVDQVVNDAGSRQCELQAAVTNAFQASLTTTPDAAAACPLESNDPAGLFQLVYRKGTLTLEAGALAAEMDLSLLVYDPATAGLRDGGSGTQRSDCVRVQGTPPCSWER